MSENGGLAISAPMPSRVKVLNITPEVLFQMLSEGLHAYAVMENGVPSDTKLVNVAHGYPNFITLLLESPAFDEVPEGAEIPALSPKIAMGRMAERTSDVDPLPANQS